VSSKSTCTQGLLQSPINIKTNKTKKCEITCDATFYYKNSKCNLILSNKNFIIDYDQGSYINFDHDVYELDKISFTNPSSHKIDNESYPLEAHLYHRSSNSGNILIVAVFIEINDAISKSSLFFNKFVNSIPEIKGKQISINTPDDWNIFNILPENKGYFLYKGSLPRYPCTENVCWIVMEDTVNCTEKFYDKIRKISKNNARNLKNINNRPIYYNNNNKTSRNYGNKLRCYTEKEFKNACAKIAANKDIIKYRSYKNLLITITIITLVLFTLFIIWIIDTKFLKNKVDILKY